MKKVVICLIVTLACFLLCGQVYATNSDNIVVNSNLESGEQDNLGNNNEQVREFTNYYCEGTEWYYYYYYPYVNDDHTELTMKLYKTKSWLEGEVELDGKMYYNVWSQRISEPDSEPGKICCIRTADNKVWKKNIDKTDEPEIMIFDFNLTPGESFTYYCENDYICSNDVTVTCQSQIEYFDDNMGGLPYMDVECTAQYTGLPFEDDYAPVEINQNRWICGIGGLGGLDEPRYRNKLLYAVYHNGVPLFDNEPSGVEELKEQYVTPLKGNKYHIDGRVFKEGDRGISISNGKKVIRN
ncbi:MAG: hypothetical protein K2M87_00305 [Muribaculaceae bacterium]|nr:hypothetical protein [Muribaculaceae bacterium]